MIRPHSSTASSATRPRRLATRATTIASSTIFSSASCGRSMLANACAWCRKRTAMLWRKPTRCRSCGGTALSCTTRRSRGGPCRPAIFRVPASPTFGSTSKVAAQGTYRAVVCSTLGGIDCLQLRQLPRAPLPPNGVRVAIKAAGLNFPDVLMCRGAYQHRPALPFVPGLEAAGIVSELANGTAAAVQVGDPVIVQTRTGGYAEEIVAAPEQLRPMPAAFSFAEAATFLVAHLTAYHALKTRA